MFYTFNHSSVSHNEQLVTDWAPEVGFFGKKRCQWNCPKNGLFFNGSKIFPVYLKCSTLKNHHKYIWQK